MHQAVIDNPNSDEFKKIFIGPDDCSFYSFAGSRFGICLSGPAWIEKSESQGRSESWGFTGHDYRWVTKEYVFENLTIEQKKTFVFNLDILEHIRDRDIHK